MNTIRKWLRKHLIWADVDQACEIKKLYLHLVNKVTITKNKVMRILNKNFGESNIQITVRRFNKILTDRKWLRKHLIWADVDQACEIKKLYLHQRFFRWLGWP